jgi:cytochrome c oxidase cbb3-type subunit 1
MPTQRNDAAVRAELSEIDASIRTASVFFTVSSVLWLLIGSVFAIIAAIKMHHPDFLGGDAWTTFGRMRFGSP